MREVTRQRKECLTNIFLRVKEAFPFLSKKQYIKFGRTFERFIKEAENIPEQDDYEFYVYIENFLASLNNAHTKLKKYSGKTFFKPSDTDVYYENKRFYLLKKNVFQGEIKKIDGKNPMDILEFHLKRIAASTKQFAINQALLWLLIAREKTKVKIVLTGRKSGSKELELPRLPINNEGQKPLGESKIYYGRIGYIKINSWSGNDTNKILEGRIRSWLKKDIKGLVIDVRDNLGGDSRIAKQFASHFFKTETLTHFLKRRENTNTIKLGAKAYYINPTTPYIDLPVILIVNSNCLSSNEYFIAAMTNNPRVITLGETTGGSSGNPVFFNVKYKKSDLTIQISTWLFCLSNKKLLEGHGVEPNIDIKRNLSDIIEKKDVFLGVALEKLKK